MASDTLADEFVDYARRKLREHAEQIARCARLLHETEIWHRTNAHTNSVGNLILHLTGNVRQWIVAGLGGETFVRDRPAEFAERGPRPTAEILGELQAVVERALEVLARLDVRALEARYSIQGYDVSGAAAVFHVVEHFSGHTAQIVHITKLLKDVDLSLYDAAGHRSPGQLRQP